MSNYTKFKKELHGFKDEIKKAVAQKTHDVAESVINKIVWASPIWTGSYIMSHRLGIDTLNLSKPTYLAIYPDDLDSSSGSSFPLAVSTAKATEYRYQALNDLLNDLKPVLTKPFSVIYITNRMGHAHNVEYLGWRSAHNDKPPYYVYQLAAFGAKLEFANKK